MAIFQVVSVSSGLRSAGLPNSHRGCQTVLDTMYQNVENITNDYKICHKYVKVYQMVIKQIKIYPSFQNVPKIGDFGMKMHHHLATLIRT
jgi:hypothetical protein